MEIIDILKGENKIILKSILAQHILDEDILWLLNRIIDSFTTVGRVNVGLPLGNLTSQLLVNIYMNEFDQYMKREVHAKYYIRFADDFVILSPDKEYLQQVLLQVAHFLEIKLKLSLNYYKVSLHTLSSGIDFLGWVNFSHHCVIRTKTKRRMLRKLNTHCSEETVSSYLGMLSHGNAYKLSETIRTTFSK